MKFQVSADTKARYQWNGYSFSLTILFFRVKGGKYENLTLSSQYYFLASQNSRENQPTLNITVIELLSN